jgi:hypothetical protein
VVVGQKRKIGNCAGSTRASSRTGRGIAMYAWICNVRQEIVPVASSYSRRLECESQARRNLCGCTEQSQSLQSRDRNTFVQHADTCRRNTRSSDRLWQCRKEFTVGGTPYGSERVARGREGGALVRASPFWYQGIVTALHWRRLRQRNSASLSPLSNKPGCDRRSSIKTSWSL